MLIVGTNIFEFEKDFQVGLVLFRQLPDLELDSRQTLEPNKDPSNPAELANPAALM